MLIFIIVAKKVVDIDAFSILHLNIRSIQKNFEKFKLFLLSTKTDFKVICLTETWCHNIEIEFNSNFQSKNYKVVHQVRNSEKPGGGVCIFIHNSLIYKPRSDYCTASNDCESLTIEIFSKTTKNVIVHVLYRPPSGNMKISDKRIKSLITNKDVCSKCVYLVGDLNLNVL